jgi:hypothetical protein
MVIHLNDSRLSTLEQIREFLAGTADATFGPVSDDAGVTVSSARSWGVFDYDRLRRADKACHRRPRPAICCQHCKTPMRLIAVTTRRRPDG